MQWFDEVYDVHKVSEHTAAVAHNCMSCSRSIAPGQRYQRAAGLGEGSWKVTKLCAPCAVLYWALRVVVRCRFDEEVDHGYSIDEALACADRIPAGVYPLLDELAFALPADFAGWPGLKPTGVLVGLRCLAAVGEWNPHREPPEVIPDSRVPVASTLETLAFLARCD